MFRFLLRRYLHAVSARRRWLLAALVAPLCYLVAAAFIPDWFTIAQTSAMEGQAPGASEVAHGIVKDPRGFFLDRQALAELQFQLNPQASAREAEEPPDSFLALVERRLSVSMPSDKAVQITYDGPDRKTGQTLVGFYSQLLADQLFSRIIQDGEEAKARVEASSPPQVESHRAAWRAERGGPAALAFALSFVAVAIVLGVVEWTDASFKSCRQVARYLNVPVLGAVPDLNKISLALRTR